MTFKRKGFPKGQLGALLGFVEKRVYSLEIGRQNQKG